MATLLTIFRVLAMNKNNLNQEIIMFKTLLISTLIISSSLSANELLTDQQAIELGMTELVPMTKIKKNLDSEVDVEILEGYDLNNDEVNSTLAKIVVIVNESDRSENNPEGQTAKVYHLGKLVYQYNVSTGSRKTKTTTSGRKYIAQTPAGFYRPKSAYKDYYSYTFFGSTMPYAVFFNGGIALHGTTHLSELGTRDSGGCVRFHPEDIKVVNELIRTTGDGSEKMSKERLCLETDPSRCITRTMYLDREKYFDVNSVTGYETDKEIWSYDALIVVKKPFN